MGIKCSRSNLSFTLARLVSLQFLLHLTLCAAQTDPYLLFANRPSIQRINLNGTGLRMLYGDDAGSNRYEGLDLDIRTGDVYVSMAGTIEMGHVDGMRDMTTLLRRDDTPSTIESVAWDWINKKLYFTDKDRQTVEVLDPETGYSKVLIDFNDNFILPRRVIVDPLSRQLYWTAWHKDFSDSGKVYQTSMDGSVNTVLFDSDTGLIQPNGLALDYAQNNLYIVDVIKDTIARSTLNTNDYEVIQRLTSAQGNGELTALEQDLPASYHASSMDFFNNELYFGDILRPPRLSKVNVNAPSGSTELVSNLRREPGSIRVVDISRQPDEADNPCADNNGGCSYLCLLSSVSSNKYTCVCQEGVNPLDCVPDLGEGTMPSISPSELNGTMATPASESVIFVVSGEIFLSVTAVLIVVVILLVIMVVVIAIIALKSQQNRISKRNSVSAMSSPRASPTHVTVGRLNDHDYISIKSRESPAPRGIVINIDAGHGSGGRSTPNQYTIHSKSPLPSNLVLQNGGNSQIGTFERNGNGHMGNGSYAIEVNTAPADMMYSDNDSQRGNPQSGTSERNGNGHMIHGIKVNTAPADMMYMENDSRGNPQSGTSERNGKGHMPNGSYGIKGNTAPADMYLDNDSAIYNQLEQVHDV